MLRNEWPTVAKIGATGLLLLLVLFADVDPDTAADDMAAAVAAVLEIARWMHVRREIDGPATRRAKQADRGDG